MKMCITWCCLLPCEVAHNRWALDCAALSSDICRSVGNLVHVCLCKDVYVTTPPWFPNPCTGRQSADKTSQVLSLSWSARLMTAISDQPLPRVINPPMYPFVPEHTTSRMSKEENLLRRKSKGKTDYYKIWKCSWYNFSSETSGVFRRCRDDGTL